MHIATRKVRDGVFHVKEKYVEAGVEKEEGEKEKRGKAEKRLGNWQHFKQTRRLLYLGHNCNDGMTQQFTHTPTHMHKHHIQTDSDSHRKRP